MPETSREHSYLPADDASGQSVARGVIVLALSTAGAVQRLRQLDASGELTRWMPELAVLKGVLQPKEHYWDVYEHSLQTVEAVETVTSIVIPAWRATDLQPRLAALVDGECTRLVLLKLAALLHDIAKPQTKIFEPSGRMRFFGHAQMGADMARQILKRLGFSARAQEMVSLMVEHHLRPGQLTNRAEAPTERALFRFFRDTGEVGIETLLLNMADHHAMRGPLLSGAEWQQHVEATRSIVERQLAKERSVELPKLVDGHEVMSTFGLRPGPHVGALLAAVQKAQARGEIASREEALRLVREIIARTT